MTARAGSIALAAALSLGAVLRLGHLALAPLGPTELEHAWAATQAATRGVVSADGVTNPAATSVQAIAFAFVEPSAFLARVPAALAGLAWAMTLYLIQSALYPGWLHITTWFNEFETIAGLGHVAFGISLGLGTWWLLRRDAGREDPHG